MSRSKRIGELLVAAELLTDDQLKEVLSEQSSNGTRLGELLVAKGLVSEHEVTQVLSNQLSVAWVSLQHVDFSKELLSLVAAEVAEEFTLIPVHFRMTKAKEKILYVAMDDPTNVPAMQRVSELTGMHIRPLIAPPSEIKRAIGRLYRSKAD